MNFNQILNIVSGTCMSHIDMKEFGYGEEALISIKKSTLYPYSFLEIPYSFSYNLSSTKRKTYTFQLVLLYGVSKTDQIRTDHTFISNAETMGEAIIFKLKEVFNANQIILDSVNGVSVRQYTDDNASGVIYDFSITGPRDVCDINQYFN